jgi:RNA polymerase sigma-70 factor (ECF subfamily)
MGRRPPSETKTVFNESGGSSVFKSVGTDVTAGELALAFREDSDAKRKAFEECVAAHGPRVLRTAYRLLGSRADAQDAAQEVFLRFFKHRDRLEGDPQAWLYRVTVNVCHDHRRRRRPETAPEFERADPAPGPLRVLEMEERKRLLIEALELLPQRERAAVVLRDIEGLSTREVAQILEVAEVTVRSQISMARLKLAKYVRSRK